MEHSGALDDNNQQWYDHVEEKAEKVDCKHDDAHDNFMHPSELDQRHRHDQALDHNALGHSVQKSREKYVFDEHYDPQQNEHKERAESDTFPGSETRDIRHPGEGSAVCRLGARRFEVPE